MQILNTYLDNIQSLAYLKTQDYHNAKDLTQDVCLRLLCKRELFEHLPESEQRKYVNQIINTVLIDNVRKHKRKYEFVELTDTHHVLYTRPTVFASIELKEQASDLSKRSLILYEMGYSDKEIALMTNQKRFQVMQTRNNHRARLVPGCWKRKRGTKPKVSPLSVVTYEKLLIVKDYIDDNIGKKHELEELLERSGLCRTRFTDMFKKYFKKPWYTYIYTRRLEVAKEMLTKDCSLEEVVHAIGWSCKKNLTTEFKKQYGQSCKEYVISCRMDKAKALLEDGHPVEYVSMISGYQYAPSFSAAFKKHFSIPPSQVYNSVN